MTVSDQLRTFIANDRRNPHRLSLDAGIDPAATHRFLKNKRAVHSPTIDRLAAELGLQLVESTVQ